MQSWRFVVRWLRHVDDLLEIVVVLALRAIAFPFRRKRWLVVVVALSMFTVGLRIGESLVGRSSLSRRPSNGGIRAITTRTYAPTPETLRLPGDVIRTIDPRCALQPFVGGLATDPGEDARLLRELRASRTDDPKDLAKRARLLERWDPIVWRFALSSEAVGVRTARSLADRFSDSARSVARGMVSDARRHLRAIQELSRATGS